MKFTFEELQEMIVIAENHEACDYFIEILKEIKSVEEFYENSHAPFWAYWYAREVIGGRFELGEETIAKSSLYSYLYARNVLKGRFELGEAAIALNAAQSFFYAKDVLHSRFPLGEKSISKEKKISESYQKFLLSL